MRVLLRFINSSNLLIIMELRIQKYLSERGICSRRQAEKYIQDGLVKLNGVVVTTLGTKIDPSKDKIELNNKAIEDIQNKVYYILNKPAGYVTTCANKDDRNVMDIVKVPERVFPVGRLDKDTTGLLLLTNDGVIAYRLTHPKFEHEKEYLVQATMPMQKEQLSKLEEGMKLFGRKTNPTRIKRLSAKRFTIVLTEGKNRQIRRSMQKVGAWVKKLQRIRIENLMLGELPIGEIRKVTESELKELKKRLKLT